MGGSAVLLKAFTFYGDIKFPSPFVESDYASVVGSAEALKSSEVDSQNVVQSPFEPAVLLLLRQACYGVAQGVHHMCGGHNL